jgi:bacillithiol biosynthesis cysteine-adding enzyme BshC
VKLEVCVSPTDGSSYHAQVKPRPVNLFFVEGGERYPVEPKDQSTFFLKGTRKNMTKVELLGALTDHSEQVSPNVLMRPLFQDTLLPTVAYVAGPGEIAYFAQFRSAYEWAGIPMPLIYPRFTATLIEDKFDKFAQKNNLELARLISDGKTYVESTLQSLSDPEIENRFVNADQSIDQLLEQLREKVTQVDQTLDGALTSVKGKVLTTLRDFQSKVLAADRRKNSTLREQLERALAALVPEDELQERELSLLYYVNKYGMGLWRALVDAVIDGTEATTEHHLLKVKELMEKSSGASEENLGSKTNSGEIGRTSGMQEPLVARAMNP